MSPEDDCVFWKLVWTSPGGGGNWRMNPLWASRKEREHDPGVAIMQSLGENKKHE